MPEVKSIRLIYMGQIPGWQTQAVYHTVAEMMTEDTPDTIIITQPADKYVCLGYHQSLDKVFDRIACEEKDIPIIRRKIGGGGTYLDPNQLFFQCIFHTSRVPANFKKVYKLMLTPAVNTLSHYGLNAKLSGTNEIEVDGKRISGTGGGQIGEASVVVGNFLFDFDYTALASIWSVPNENYRELGKQAMEDHITTLDKLGVVEPMDRIADQLIKAYENFFQRRLNPGGMTIDELERAGEVGAQLRSDSFLNLFNQEDDSGLRNPLKISRNVYIHQDKTILHNKTISGSFRVENGLIHTAKLDNPKEGVESALKNQPFESWGKIIAEFKGNN